MWKKTHGVRSAGLLLYAAYEIAQLQALSLDFFGNNSWLLRGRFLSLAHLFNEEGE